LPIFVGRPSGSKSADEQLNRETAPGRWTDRVVAKHVLTPEEDSLKTIAADQATGTTSR
jgi:hypothetical protein